jgi:hypothetical protein
MKVTSSPHQQVLVYKRVLVPQLNMHQLMERVVYLIQYVANKSAVLLAIVLLEMHHELLLVRVMRVLQILTLLMIPLIVCLI